MVTLLACLILSWTLEAMIQAALPLMILDRGGDAATVGLAVAAFAVPTILLRPILGNRIDREGQAGIHRLGTALSGIVAVAYVLVPVVVVPLVRLGQGFGWAMTGTANNVLLARLAPATRRGEATGYFSVMWALGFVIGPPLALLLYQEAGFGAPFLAAAVFGGGAFLAASRLARMVPAPVAAAATAPVAAGRPGRLIERSALPSLAIVGALMTGQALFLGFAAVYARELGAPVHLLALHFPLYGVLLGAGQLLSGRLSDRFGRRPITVAGTLICATGFGVALLPFGWTSFTIGGLVFATGVSVVGPAVGAATMDRAPSGRLGAAMATYSLGYQLGSGLGGATWGFLIASVGLAGPFVVGLAFQLVGLTIALVSLSAGRSADPHPVPTPQQEAPR